MNKTIRLLLTLDVFRITALGLLGPIYAIFVEEIGGDILDAGLAFAVYSVTLGIMAWLLGKTGDRFNKIIFLTGAHVLISLGLFSYLLVENQFQLILVQIILGIGGAIGAPIFDALFSTYLDRGKFSSEWATWESENFVFTGLAALAGAAIANFWGFKTLFVVMGCLSLVSFIFVYFLHRHISKSRVP